MTSSKSSRILQTIRNLLVVSIIVVLLGGAWWWSTRPKPVAVVFKTVDTGRVESTIANTRAGTLESCQRARLSSIIGGRIELLAVKEGDHVQKGQLLMKLWNDDQRAQNLLARTQVEGAKQRIVEACSMSAHAEREAQRQDQLRAQNYISASRAESSRTEADVRKASCEAAKADLERAKAQVNATAVEQGRTTLYAPFTGTVAKIVGEVGEYSTPSPPGIMTPPAIDLIDETCVYIKAPMDEVDSPKISEGQPVRISLDALPKKTFPGRIKRVAPYVLALEKQSRTVDVEAIFDNAAEAGKLLIGYSANVEIILSVHEHAVRVPTSSILEGNRVLVAGPDGMLEERKIRTGLANWEYTEVVEGLAAGDQVVASLEREGVKAGAAYVVDDSTAPAAK